VPATFDDVAAVARALPEVAVGERHGRRTWPVGGKGVAWERPFSARGALAGVFTMQHLDGYPAVPIQLDRVHTRALRRLLTDAWLAATPAKVAEAFLAAR